MHSISAFLLVCLISASQTAILKDVSQLPSFIGICVRDESFDDCLKENLQSLLPKLAKGDQTIQIDSLDPYIEPEVQFKYENDQIRASAVARNVRLFGFSTANIRDVRSKLTDQDMRLEVDVSFPRLDMEGKLKGTGHLGNIAINTNTYYNITMIDVKATWVINGEVEERSGKQYMRIKSFTMRPDVGKMKIYFGNIFPGNEELNNAAMFYVNENWRMFYRELLPIAEEFWNVSMARIANKIFVHVPYNQLIPKP